jgi:putative transposase
MIDMMVKAGKAKVNNKDFQFWQQHNHPIELSGNSIVQKRIDYIHENPVRAGFVEKPSDWLMSSARDYEGIQGPIEIYFLD